MDINSYETFKVVETMREYGAPYSALSVATGLTESKLKAYCRREDIGVCWISVYLSIIRREDTGRVFALEALLEEDTMRFCRERNRAFWRDAEKLGCIPKMAEAILEPYENRTGPVTCVFDLRRYGADRERFLHRVAEVYGK